jgi:hypothetical protein
MKTSSLSWYIGCCFFIGIVTFAYFREWIIIRTPSFFSTGQAASSGEATTIKKKAKLIFWRNGKWHSEYQEIIWPEHSADKLAHLVNNWLTLLDEDALMDKKVTLQTAMLSPAGSTIYLSFDRNPLPTECSTFTTWMWVEGLLKTIRENGVPINAVQLLVHHQPLVDNHLDFTNPWPIAGFLDI